MKEKKILYLSLKKEWYNLIDGGLKTEDYREIKPYWGAPEQNKVFVIKLGERI